MLAVRLSDKSVQNRKVVGRNSTTLSISIELVTLVLKWWANWSLAPYGQGDCPLASTRHSTSRHRDNRAGLSTQCVPEFRPFPPCHVLPVDRPASWHTFIPSTLSNEFSIATIYMVVKSPLIALIQMACDLSAVRFIFVTMALPTSVQCLLIDESFSLQRRPETPKDPLVSFMKHGALARRKGN